MTDRRQSSRPLDGYRIIEPATMIAGPFCSSILAEFGAEVIKVELPGQGDPLRSFGTMTETESTLNWLNEGRNKKSITLDLHRKEGIDLFKRLVEKSDVVVENFRPGTMEKWGLGYEDLKSINEAIILIRISAYGQSGPYSARPGYARVAHGFGGLSYLAGESGGTPVVPGSTSLADYVSGLYGALGALLAIVEKQKSGGGQSVDIALYEGIFRMLDEMAPAYARDGLIRERMGADTVNVTPHSHYRTRDGKWVAIACSSDRMFKRLAAAMGQDELATRERFATMRQRLEHREAINQIVGQWVESLTRQELMERCLPLDVPVGPLNSIEDIFNDEHIRARRNLVEMDTDTGGSITVPNVIPRLSETPGRLDTLGPRLGAHNTEIYRGLLGLSSKELDTLKSSGII